MLMYRGSHLMKGGEENDGDAASSSSASSSSSNSDDVDAISSEHDEHDLEEAAKALTAMKSLSAAASTGEPCSNKAGDDASSSSSTAQDESIDEDEISSGCESDATDLFHLDTEPAATWETVQDKDRRVAHVLA